VKQEQAARADAETAGRAKDEFLATLSHELRTPLNALVGWLWWLRKGELDEARQARALDTIDRNTQALAQLVEDLLDVSRIITGKLRLTTRVVHPAPVADAAVDAIRPAAVAKSIELLTTIDPGAGPVLADPDRLQQIMWNLLSNAIKFTPEKGRVGIRLENAGAEVRLAVSDSGKGIAPGLLPYIFDRFRPSETITATTMGLGLGLSIVRHLVEIHGGRIEAASAGEGYGATFTVILPVHSAAEPAATPATSENDGTPMEGLAILVVEDDADARRWLVQTLERWGARVATAGSGREALDAVTRERLDVLVSDIRLPDTDGYELIRKIRDIERALGRYTPAVALTAYPRVEDRARALQAGYQMHVSKPVAPHDLAAVIATLTNRHVDA
jgi:CheY-like chemotaxis protein